MAAAAKKTTPPPPVDTLEQGKFAEQYGYAYALMKSSPELYGLLKTAIAKKWTADKFTAAMHNSQWYQKHSENWRMAETQRLSDPKTWAQNRAQTIEKVQQLAAQVGAKISGQSLSQLVNDSLYSGTNKDEAHLRSLLSTYVTLQNGHMTGEAGTVQDKLAAVARANGVTMPDSWYQGAAQNVTANAAALQDHEDTIRKTAASTYGAFADKILAGQNLEDLIGGYKQSMQNILEVDGSNLSVFDPTIRKAITNTDAAGNPTTVPLWKFETQLRQDPRWQQTQNGRNATLSLAQNLLKNWGF